MTGAEYPFTIRPLTAAEGGGFSIAFPDLPGCIAAGTTIAEAISAGAEAREQWIASKVAAGREVPPPRSATDRPKPREAPWIAERIERIAAASTREEWNRAAADASFALLFGDPARTGETVTATGDWRLPLAMRLAGLIETGFTKRPGKPAALLEAVDDSKILERLLQRNPEMTKAQMIEDFARRFEITKAAAKLKVERAETRLPATPPRARPFGHGP